MRIFNLRIPETIADLYFINTFVGTYLPTYLSFVCVIFPFVNIKVVSAAFVKINVLRGRRKDREQVEDYKLVAIIDGDPKAPIFNSY